MTTRWLIALLLTVMVSVPSFAQDGGRLVLWDERIQNALGRIILDAEECASYARSSSLREGCAERERSLRDYRQLTELDRFVLFADKYANARFKRRITESTELKFRADVPDVLRQKADFKVQLDIDF